MQIMWTLEEEISRVEIGKSAKHRNLTLFPLARKIIPARQLDYLLLEDGIAQGKVRVTELTAGGSVPELRLENTGDLPVLLVDGEELLGAKQNRVLNLTILAPPKHTTVIPVSCVEAGRWSRAVSDLRTADHVMYSGLRAKSVLQVTQSMRLRGSPLSNQAEVWEDIADKATRLHAKSPTGAMFAMYESHANSIEEFTRAFSWSEGQCGVAFAISGRLLGLDMFDHPEVMRRFFQKLIRSYALDALDSPPEPGETLSPEFVTGFLNQMATAQSFSNNALGLGKDVRFNGPKISGAALWAQDRYIHICAFAGAGEKPERSSFWTRISRPSRRRIF
jgi:hypothetical protein